MLLELGHLPIASQRSSAMRASPCQRPLLAALLAALLGAQLAAAARPLPVMATPDYSLYHTKCACDAGWEGKPPCSLAAAAAAAPAPCLPALTCSRPPAPCTCFSQGCHLPGGPGHRGQLPGHHAGAAGLGVCSRRRRRCRGVGQRPTARQPPLRHPLLPPSLLHPSCLQLSEDTLTLDNYTSTLTVVTVEPAGLGSGSPDGKLRLLLVSAAASGRRRRRVAPVRAGCWQRGLPASARRRVAAGPTLPTTLLHPLTNRTSESMGGS